MKTTTVTTKKKVAKPRQKAESLNKSHLFQMGQQAGLESAVVDYNNNKVNLDIFEEDRDYADFYVIGFEVGYLKKLAEIALY